MGTWAGGPFDNDRAADFLGELESSPARAVTKALRAVAKVRAGAHLDLDLASAGWAAAELVALSFGYGDSRSLEDEVLDAASKLRPKEDLRRLALDVTHRIGDRASSELASEWFAANEGERFDGALAELRSRLEAAEAGPRELPKPRKGDLIAVPVDGASPAFVLAQVVGAGEVAVFDGTYRDEASAHAAVGQARAQRIPISVNKLLRRGRSLGNLPLRKDLRGKKLYAGPINNGFYSYIVATASAGGARETTYDEAKDCDALRPYDEEAVRDIAIGRRQVERVKSPAEREAEFCAARAERWAARRRETSPDPFGDPIAVEQLLGWFARVGMDMGIRLLSLRQAPDERYERRDYAFAALVALWRGTWPRDQWPSRLDSRFPARPPDDVMAKAVNAARSIAAKLLARESELRLLWEGAPDGGAALRAHVARLQSALAE